MSILKKLLEDINITDEESKLKQLCDEIMEEEKNNFTVDKKFIPHGPTIFLSLECPKDFLENIIFICLERDLGNFIVSKWTLKKERISRQSSYMIPLQNFNAERILYVYVNILKAYRGELKNE